MTTRQPTPEMATANHHHHPHPLHTSWTIIQMTLIPQGHHHRRRRHGLRRLHRFYLRSWWDEYRIHDIIQNDIPSNIPCSCLDWILVEM